ncbi:YodC family protein [Phytohalomonas tamaricis]|uniref:YodC family protein n=1 Tax=Phytohalomonas tamaricis TaxID=2081032 RepID=UPI000D0B35E2|nr:DUF2158 domain-containing protein [Phytohalomonas tamaricis]
MKNPYVVGDVVRLKSGGPKMTVTEASFDDSVAAHWFDSHDILHTGVFPTNALVRFEADGKIL